MTLYYIYLFFSIISVDNVNLDSEEVAVIKDSCNTKCESATMLNSDIINEYVANGGEYIKNIEKIYTEDELEQGSPGNAFAPKIVSAYVENGEINPTTSETYYEIYYSDGSVEYETF